MLIEIEDDLEELVDHLAWAATQSPKVRASLRELSDAVALAGRDGGSRPSQGRAGC